MFTIISTKEDQHNDFNSMIIKICMGTLSDEETQKFLEETGLRILDKEESEALLTVIKNILKVESSDNFLDNIRVVQHNNGVYEISVRKNNRTLNVMFIINKNNKICLSSRYYAPHGFQQIQKIMGDKLTKHLSGTYIEQIESNENINILNDMIYKNGQNLIPCDSSEYTKVVPLFFYPIPNILHKVPKEYFFKEISNGRKAYIVKTTDGNSDVAFMQLNDQFIYVLRNKKSTYRTYIIKAENDKIKKIAVENDQIIMAKMVLCPVVTKTEEMLNKYFFGLLEDCDNILYKFNHKHKIDGFEQPKSVTPTKMTHEELIELSADGNLQERDIITK